MTVITNGPDETEKLGEEIAKLLRPGDVIAFKGPLGAGKTTFTIGLARGLDLDAWVSSPTFALMYRYPPKAGSTGLCHFDMYRISGYDDLYSTGFFDYLDTDDILAIEWSENIAEFLPEDTITVEIGYGEGDCRSITVSGDDRF